jgi:hypothetical protein
MKPTNILRWIKREAFGSIDYILQQWWEEVGEEINGEWRDVPIELE